jgi:hypothetical protein
VLAPKPAGSRLFIPQDNAWTAALAVARAMLRHGRDLLGINNRDSGWRNWFSRILSNARALYLHDNVALIEDLSLWDSTFLLAYTEGGVSQLLWKSEIVQKHGARVSIGPQHSKAELKDGLDLADRLTEELSRMHGFLAMPGMVDLERTSSRRS